MSDLNFKKESELPEECDRICKLQYENLRECFTKLIDETLGEDYYNLADDRYSCDKFCCDDLKWMFDKIKNKLIFWRIISIVLIVVVVLLIIFIIK